MPTYTVRDPKTGRTVKLTGDSPPTAQELEQVFASLPGRQPARAEDFMESSAPDGSATRRFLTNFGEQLNPVTMVKGLASMATSPIETGKRLYQAQADQFAKAGESWQRGGLLGATEAAGHALAGSLPVLGPAAAAAGEQIGEGDVAGGLGKATGILAPFAASAAVSGVRAARAPGRAAALERQAVDQVASRVLAPGNARYVDRAQRIAPEVLKRGLTGDRAAIRETAESAMESAAAQIDDAIMSAGGPQTAVMARPVIDRLRTVLAENTTTVQRGGQTVRVPIAGAEGKVTELASRIRQLEQASRVNRGSIPFDEFRRIRDVNYGVADAARGFERAGNVAASDAGWAAKETGAAIRQQFADQIPELAGANAEFHFWKTLDDILDPAKGRPKATKPPTGVTGGDRVSGAVAGSLIHPAAGFVMSNVLPWLRNRMSDPSWLLADANQKMQLATALRAGNIGRARRILAGLSEATPVTTTASAPATVQP